MKSYIKGLSYYLPETVLGNGELASLFPEWSVEKIEKKLGIKERHIAASDQTASDLAFNAAKKLFAEYDINPGDIDFLIFCTQSPDYILPTTACILQERLGLKTGIGAYDLNLGCSGFVYGLLNAKLLIESAVANNVLLLTAETYTKYIHPKDKSNRTIFADGAAACLVGKDGFAEIGNFTMGTDGKGAENLIVRSGGARHKAPMDDLIINEFGNPMSGDYIFMDGPEILNYTLARIPEMVSDVLRKNDMTMDDIDLHVYHQANAYIAKLQRKKLRIPEDKYYCCFEHCGNTVSSTIPIALKEAIKDGSIMQGSVVMSVAQGLGYSWGGFILKF